MFSAGISWASSSTRWAKRCRETYRQGIAAGMTDFGGTLFHINEDGSKSKLTKFAGQNGYYVNTTSLDYSTAGPGTAPTVVVGDEFVPLEDQQGLKVFATGNYEENFNQAMKYMNGLSNVTFGFVMESGKIAVLPQEGYIYKGKRKTDKYHDGAYNVRLVNVVPNKHNKAGYHLLIDSNWERASKMLVSGFISTWGAYKWDMLAEKVYYMNDRMYRGLASRLGVDSLIYFHNPPGWDHSVVPPQQAVYYTEIPINGQ